MAQRGQASPHVQANGQPDAVALAQAAAEAAVAAADRAEAALEMIADMLSGDPEESDREQKAAQDADPISQGPDTRGGAGESTAPTATGEDNPAGAGGEESRGDSAPSGAGG